MSALFVITFTGGYLAGQTAIMAHTRGCAPVIVTPAGEMPMVCGAPFTCAGYER